MSNIDEKQRDKQIRILEQLAVDVLKTKTLWAPQRRPILVEFCGSPKSGKTTCITALNLFLKRNDFKTKVLTERASVCPILNKTHPFFNIWTACVTIAEITEHLTLGEWKVDVIMADRGIFDALCWFKWLSENPDLGNPYLGRENYDALKTFLTMKMWRQYYDLIYIFKAKPVTSLHREYANLLTRKTGSIMNETVLSSFNHAIELSKTEFANFFRNIKEIETTQMNADRVNFEVTREVLKTLRGLFDEDIGYITSDIGMSLKLGVNDCLILKSQKLTFGRRLKVEKKDTIQPIPIAVLTDRGRNNIYILKKHGRSLKRDSPEWKRVLLYAGGHIRLEDREYENEPLLDIARRTIERELSEEIGQPISTGDIEPFLIYDPRSLKSRKHLAICYVLTIDLAHSRLTPNPNEFIQPFKFGESLSGEVIDVKNLIQKKDNIETWGANILYKVFGIDIRESGQATLFEDW